jgi:hypothetical protein
MPPTYLVVERSDKDLRGTVAPSEITATPTYRDLRTTFKTVVLRLPDNCYEQELHKAQNQESSQLESRCGIPLQVLERTLTQEAGYQVLSWAALMGIEHQQNVPVHVAAQQLGADIVIVVNDMFAGPEKSGEETTATYRYFSSNPKGERSQPASVFPADSAWLKAFVRARAGDDPRAREGSSIQARLSATIVLAKGGADVVAPSPQPPGGLAPATRVGAMPAPMPVPPPTPGIGRSGEAIWFYNQHLGEQNHAQKHLLFLFAGVPVSRYSSVFPDRAPIDASDPNRHYWWPLQPLGDQAQPQPKVEVATSEETFSSAVGVEREKGAELFRQIARDFINRFKGG